MSGETAVYEIVVFGLRAGADLEAFVRDVPATDAFLARQPGFIERQLMREQGGERWVDCVRWESSEAAVVAFEAFGRELGETAFARSIDPDSVVALHTVPYGMRSAVDA